MVSPWSFRYGIWVGIGIRYTVSLKKQQLQINCIYRNSCLGPKMTSLCGSEVFLFLSKHQRYGACLCSAHVETRRVQPAAPTCTVKEPWNGGGGSCKDKARSYPPAIKHGNGTSTIYGFTFMDDFPLKCPFIYMRFPIAMFD